MSKTHKNMWKWRFFFSAEIKDFLCGSWKLWITQEYISKYTIQTVSVLLLCFKHTWLCRMNVGILLNPSRLAPTVTLLYVAPSLTQRPPSGPQFGSFGNLTDGARASAATGVWHALAHCGAVIRPDISDSNFFFSFLWKQSFTSYCNCLCARMWLF